MSFRTDMRAAALALLEGYQAANPDALRQVYPGRPASIYSPVGFIDAINEPELLFTVGPTQRNPAVDIILIQGLFDSKEAVNLQDALVDGFIDYCRTHFQQAGGSTIATIVRTEDIPNFTPDWIEDAPIYYATRLTLVGLKLEAGLV